MILGVSTYIRIWGLDLDPDVASRFANGKVLFVDLPANLFANANPLFKQIRGFFCVFFLGPAKILEQSKMLMECTCGACMDFQPHALASASHTFREWQQTERSDTFSGMLRHPAVIQGTSRSCG